MSDSGRARDGMLDVILAATVMVDGGVLRHMRDLSTGLRARGHRVRLSGPAASHAMRAVAREVDIPFHPLESGPPRGGIWHLHLADTFDRRALPMLVNARRQKCAVIVTEHLPRTNASDPSLTDDPRTVGAYQAKTLVKRLQFRLADQVICVSPASREFVATRYGVPLDRLRLISNGVGAAPYSSSHHLDHDFAARTGVVSVGAVIHQKGHDILIRAAGRSTVPWTVDIVGEGRQMPELEALARREAPGRVRFHGWVDDVRPMMRAAQVMCLPSRWESFGYVVGEARREGTPVVATRVDGVVDQIENGRTGVLVDVGDVDALARAIDDVLTDEARWGQLSRQGAAAQNDHPLEPMVDAVAALYREADARFGGSRTGPTVVARPAGGGVAHVASSVAAGLRRTGDEVLEIVLDDAEITPGTAALRRLWQSRRVVRSAAAVHVEVGRTSRGAFWFAAGTIAMRRDVVVVAHDLPILVGHPGAAFIHLRSRWRQRLAYRVIAPLLDRPARSFVMRRAGAVGVFSEQAREIARTAGSRRVEILDHGADVPVAGPPPSAGQAVVFCGFVSPDKGIEDLLDAWRHVGRRTDLPLVIGGDVPLADEDWARRMRSVADRLPSPPRWLSGLTDESFQGLIAEAAIVVLPYRTSNPVSGVAVRAAIQGRPMIGTRVPALQAAIEDGTTGLLVDVAAPDALASALLSLLADGAYRDRLGAAAASRAGKHHTWERHVAGVRSLMKLAGSQS